MTEERAFNLRSASSTRNRTSPICPNSTEEIVQVIETDIVNMAPAELIKELRSVISSVSTKGKSILPAEKLNKGLNLLNALESNLILRDPFPPLPNMDQTLSTATRTSYADVIKAVPQPQKSKNYTVLLYPSENPIDCDSDQETKRPTVGEILQEKIKPAQEKIRIKNYRNIRNNGLAIDCEDENDIHKLVHKIQNSDLKELITHKIPLERNPKCIFYFVPKSTTEEDVAESIALATGISINDVKFCFKLKGNEHEDHWVVELPSHSLQILKQKGKLIVNWSICRLREFINIRRCYKCQRYGHTQIKCKAQRKYCSSCSGDHDSKNCNGTQRICINCRDSNEKRGTRYDERHSASNRSCPVYKKAVDNYKNLINY